MLRPVVAIGGGVPIQLYTYKSEGPPWPYPVNSGWGKQWITQVLDPYVHGDISTSIGGSQKWEVNKNLLMSSWYCYPTWYVGTGGYSNGTYETTASVTGTHTIKAINAEEAEIGTVWSGTFTISGFQEVTIVALTPTNQKFNNSNTFSGSGSWTGKLNGFYVYSEWSATMTTTLLDPIVGGMSATLTEYANLGYVKA